MSTPDHGSVSGCSSSPGMSSYDEKPYPLQHMNTASTLVDRSISFDEKHHPIENSETANTQLTSFEQAQNGNLYDSDGSLVLLPAPTQDPRDPMNLSTSRKIVALVFLCFYGAMAAAAELILGAMLPVFALQYAGIDPKILLPLTESMDGFPAGVDALAYLALLPGAPPLLHIYLLASLPVLVIGITNLAFIPLAIAIGRRPVIIACGFVAISGAIWAGCSQSLASHLLARCFQAFGAGTVESLIPFIIQDICHVHQRNVYISSVFAAQVCNSSSTNDQMLIFTGSYYYLDRDCISISNHQSELALGLLPYSHCCCLLPHWSHCFPT